MGYQTLAPRRLIASLAAAALASAGVGLTAAGASDEVDLIGTLELPDGDLAYELDLGRLHFFDEERSPFAVQIIDGCRWTGRMWVFGAGLSGAAIPLRVTDLVSGKEERIVLPPFEPGKPVETVLVTDALPVCDDSPSGGRPQLDGLVTFKAASGQGRDFSGDLEVSSDGRKDYRRISAAGYDSEIISKGSPVAAIDTAPDYDQLFLLAEARTPRHVEGVVFTGPQGMLPARDKLERALKGISTARVRRASETAKNGRVPAGIRDELGLRRVDFVHHLVLDPQTIGSDYYLAESGWIKGAGSIEPPQPVPARFTVELVRADGEATAVPLVGPLVGSDLEGELWVHASEDALVEIVDACEVGSAFWTIAGARTEEPLELRVTDTEHDESVTHLLWTEGQEFSYLSDTGALATCP